MKGARRQLPATLKGSLYVTKGACMTVWKRVASVLVWLALVPASAYAQASITGVVKDSSGAVLPGVIVEASSPALIEKTRSAVSDAGGQYRIVDLRAGTYAVSFTLTGFGT